MIKDRSQKELCLKFCAVQKILPFAEALVRVDVDVDESPLEITDVDVMGIQILPFGQRIIIFDCKSGMRSSAMSRALWSRGLQELVGADQGFVIQAKEVRFSHQIAAGQIRVQIHSDVSFSAYAETISSDFSIDSTYLNNMSLWETLSLFHKPFPTMLGLRDFLLSGAALERTPIRGLRRVLAEYLRAAPELDPAKQLHVFLFMNVLSVFLLFVAQIVNTIKEKVLLNLDREEFASMMRYYMWGGKESYNFRVRLKQLTMAPEQRNGEILDLPRFDDFLELIRLILDGPSRVVDVPYLTREMAFRYMADSRNVPDKRLKALLATNDRARQFIFLALNYLTAVGGVPKEFQTICEESVNGLAK